MTETHVSHFADSNYSARLTDALIHAFHLFGRKLRSTRNYYNKTGVKPNHIASVKDGDDYFIVSEAKHLLGISSNFNMKKLSERYKTLCLIQHLGLRRHDPKYTTMCRKAHIQTIRAAYDIVNSDWKKRFAEYTESEVQVNETERLVDSFLPKFQHTLHMCEDRFGKTIQHPNEYDDACKRLKEANDELINRKNLFSRNETENNLSLLIYSLNKKAHALHDKAIAMENQVHFMECILNLCK